MLETPAVQETVGTQVEGNLKKTNLPIEGGNDRAVHPNHGFPKTTRRITNDVRVLLGLGRTAREADVATDQGRLREAFDTNTAHHLTEAQAPTQHRFDTDHALRVLAIDTKILILEESVHP